MARQGKVRWTHRVCPAVQLQQGVLLHHRFGVLVDKEHALAGDAKQEHLWQHAAKLLPAREHGTAIVPTCGERRTIRLLWVRSGFFPETRVPREDVILPLPRATRTE